MIHVRIEGYDKVIGEKQGYKPLFVRTTPVIDPVSKKETSLLETAWTPTPKQLEALNKGASVHVKLLTTGHPPIKVDVGPTPAIVEDDICLSQ